MISQRDFTGFDFPLYFSILLAVVDRGRGQHLAASGNISAAHWQPNGSGRAADGSGVGRAWQRVGAILAAYGSGPMGGGMAAVVELGHGGVPGLCGRMRGRRPRQHYAITLQYVKSGSGDAAILRRGDSRTSQGRPVADAGTEAARGGKAGIRRLRVGEVAL
jgi:hypothetical protein